MDVPEYLASLTHPRKQDVLVIRSALLESEPGLTESIKWNAPNFIFAGEDRVTFRLQPGDRLELVLHRGTRRRDDTASFTFDDPSGLIAWAAPDRGVISIRESDDLDEVVPRIVEVVHRWVRA